MLRSKIYTALLSAIGYLATAQQVSYEVLGDNPDKAYTQFIAPEFGSEYNATDLSVFLGVNGRKEISKLTVEGVLRFDIYSANSGSATFLAEGGVFLPLKTKTITKEVPIILSYNPTAGTKYENGNTYRLEETKSITIPSGQYKNQYGARLGAHFRSIGAEEVINGIDPGNINLGGIYLGGQMTSRAHVVTKINNDVERIGAGFTRFYADLMIFPISTVSEETLLPATKGDGTFGWRVGYQWFVSPHDGDYKFLGNSVFGAELGSRPFSGFMFNISWGFAFMRS